MAKLLTIDNYDNFVYALVNYPYLLGASTTVVRNDVVDLVSISSCDGVLASPGPGTPAEVGATVAVIEQCAQTKTLMLGVCLRHQALAEVFGGVVSHALTLVHGKTSVTRRNSRELFEGPPSPLTVGEYYPSVAEPDIVRELVIIARTDDGIVTGVEHTELLLQGVQFHLGSMLTQGGHRVLANWLAVCGQPEALEAACGKVSFI